MQLSDLSTYAPARRLTPADIPAILAVCRGNPLFYRYHPPLPDEAAVLADLTALPPGKEAADKYYVGFFQDETLIAVLDLILGYPNDETAFIGFFMVDASMQSRGCGSSLITELCTALRQNGYRRARLAIDEGNPQSAAFWTKNGFAKTGQRIPNDISAYYPMERTL